MAKQGKLGDPLQAIADELSRCSPERLRLIALGAVVNPTEIDELRVEFFLNPTQELWDKLQELGVTYDIELDE